MVEMNETASILNNVSSRSLVLLDEIGRGTSTYDGISIAWAITEFLHDHPVSRAKVMFATHYHELNEMEDSFARIKNYHVSVKEVGNQVVFLRKLKRGGSAHSFGIHVAEMAGMPRKVIERATALLFKFLIGLSCKSNIFFVWVHRKTLYLQKISTMEKCHILFGSNMGDKNEIFAQACLLINNRCGRIVAISSSYESEPWKFPFRLVPPTTRLSCV